MDNVCTDVQSAYVMVEDTDQKAALEEILNALGCTLPPAQSTGPLLETQMSGGGGTKDPDQD